MKTIMFAGSKNLRSYSEGGVKHTQSEAGQLGILDPLGGLHHQKFKKEVEQGSYEGQLRKYAIKSCHFDLHY